MTMVNLGWTVNLLHLNTPFTQNSNQYFKKFPQDSNATVNVDVVLKKR